MLSGTAAALAQALPIRGGDGAELGAVSRIAITDPLVRPIEANADDGPLGWWSSTKDHAAASGTIEVLMSANTEDSAGAGSDESPQSRLNFPTATLSPASGAESELGAAAGIAVGLGTGAPTAWESSSMPAGTGTVFEAGPPSGMSMDRGFVPPMVGHTPGARRDSGAAQAARQTAGHAPVLATPKPGTAVVTPTNQSSSSTGGGIPAPAGPTGQLGPNPFIVTHNAADILPQLYGNTAADPEMGLVQVPDGAQGQNPMTQGFSAGGVR